MTTPCPDAACSVNSRLAPPGWLAFWGRLTAFAMVLMCASALPVWAQPRGRAKPKAPDPSATPVDVSDKTDKPDKDSKKKAEPTTMKFGGLDLNGHNRTPQLLYVLERANEELERASLEKRSFIPHIVRSLEEEQL